MRGLTDRLRAFARRQNETLDVDMVDIPLHGLPEILDGYRIAIVSDLHIQTLGPYHRKILAAVAAARPECILVVGDTIDSDTQLVDSLEPFFRALSDLAPVIAVLGNNDCQPGRIDLLRDMYARSGVTLLENETRLLSARGLPLRITGLIDPEAEKRGIEPHRTPEQKAEYVPLASTLPPTQQSASPSSIQANKEEDMLLPSLLLLHQPQLARHYAGLHPSLIISGHTHGGQFRLPNGQGVYAPGQGLFPKLDGGLHDIDGTPILISRGLGNHVIFMRLNNPPHLPIVVLRRASGLSAAN